ncbi:DUF5753 domain-containing protein [Nocardiopsis halophila]|uniref:DUF5753 domain-containing protein n=1 Tax=Nocardiopsis halophila TaxID=141692 RepID=UPI0012693574|nr:DUF5753 domain-containing protein [Nocardiopsis halophila]
MIHGYQSIVFPGYLQTAEYAAALVRYGAPWLATEAVTRKAQERAEHGGKMTRSNKPILWCVLDETALWRRYGSPSITYGQFEHISTLIESDRLNVQFIPARSRRHPGNSGSFIILSSGAPEVVYTERIHEGQIITERGDVSNYRLLFGALQGAAAAPDESLTILQKEMRKIRDEEL